MKRIINKGLAENLQRPWMILISTITNCKKSKYCCGIRLAFFIQNLDSTLMAMLCFFGLMILKEVKVRPKHHSFSFIFRGNKLKKTFQRLCFSRKINLVYHHQTTAVKFFHHWNDKELEYETFWFFSLLCKTYKFMKMFLSKQRPSIPFMKIF